MTIIDKIKYQGYAKHLAKKLQTHKIVYFDIIHDRYTQTQMSNSKKFYQSVIPGIVEFTPTKSQSQQNKFI